MDLVKRKKFITFLIVIAYFTFFLGYAYIRYIHFKGLDFLINANFIINKAFAATAIVSVSTSYLISSFSKLGFSFFKRRQAYKRFFGLSGFVFIILHIFFGFRIIKPELLPQFFGVDDEFSLRGQIIVLLGILALILFLFPAISSMNNVMKKLGSKKWLLFQRIGYAAISVVMYHIMLIGSSNWFKIDKWDGSMPPITLICFIIITLTLIIRLFALVKVKK